MTKAELLRAMMNVPLHAEIVGSIEHDGEDADICLTENVACSAPQKMGNKPVVYICLSAPKDEILYAMK